MIHNEMNLYPQVAIVIANYNGKRVIKDCLNSILRTEYPNKMIIVVDDASTDDSAELAAAVSGVTVIRNQKNLGFAGTNNRGIRYALSAGAEYVMLLNNDTIVEKNLLCEMIKRADTRTVVVPKICFYSRPNVIWYAGGELESRFFSAYNEGCQKRDQNQYNQEKCVTFACGCCVLLHRSIIERVGLLSEKYFMYCEDTDYSWRLKNCGYIVRYVPAAKLYHRVSFSSSGKNGRKTYYKTRNNLFIIRQYGGKNKKKAYFCYIKRIAKGIDWATDEKKYFALAIKDFMLKKYGKM